MSRPIIVLVGLVYAYVAVDIGIKGNLGMAILYGSYSLSNIGLWMMAG
jgi:hypothetical protein